MRFRPLRYCIHTIPCIDLLDILLPLFGSEHEPVKRDSIAVSKLEEYCMRLSTVKRICDSSCLGVAYIQCFA